VSRRGFARYQSCATSDMTRLEVEDEHSGNDNGLTAMATSDNMTGDTGEKIFVGKGEQPAWLTLALGNRHGLVTGATGTGKTVSLQVMAEGFARAGVPVFAADIKGDLS